MSGTRRFLAGVGFAVLMAAVAFAAVGQPVRSQGRMLNKANARRLAEVPSTSRMAKKDRTYLSAVRWPQRGQAALVVGKGQPTASPHQRPVAIASVAKVMTAYLTLERYPLSGGHDGFTVTVTAAQARAEAQDAAQDQSVVAVRSGEQLTERQLLEALLIPSGNNIARMLAARVAGSESRFLAEMNARASGFGMTHTVYTDPSGWDTGTVSTAADQLRVFRRAMRFRAFRQIVSMASVTLPVAGTLSNTNPLIAEGYAGKTGSDSAAGACLAFFTHVTLDGHRLTAVGVVLGQWEDNSTSVLLAAAGQAAEQLVGSVAPAAGARTTAAPTPASGRGRDPGGRHRRPPARPPRSRRRDPRPTSGSARMDLPAGGRLRSTRPATA